MFGRLRLDGGPGCPLVRLALLGMAGIWAGEAVAEAPSQWMVTLNGGSLDREGDRTRAYGAVALTRRLGKGYIRASVTRFGSAVAQVDVTLPSTYTLGFLSAGTTFGHWFVDGYAAAGWQHYRSIRVNAVRFGQAAPEGCDRRPVSGSFRSGVLGGGGDVGYVQWLGRKWSVTPSASVQYLRSKSLREQVGSDGPSEYETRENGVTASATLRLDRWLGRDRASGLGLHVTRYATTNISAALVSGTRGAIYSDLQGGRRSDGWTELGGNATLRLFRSLYADAGVSRTFGAASGDVTATSAGLRWVF